MANIGEVGTRVATYTYAAQSNVLIVLRQVLSDSSEIWSPQVRLVELVHDEVDSGTNMPCRLLQLQFSLNLMQI